MVLSANDLQLCCAYNMCQCFVIISFKFGNARQYVTDKGMHCLSWRFVDGAVVFDRVGQPFKFAV